MEFPRATFGIRADEDDIFFLELTKKYTAVSFLSHPIGQDEPENFETIWKNPFCIGR